MNEIRENISPLGKSISLLLDLMGRKGAPALALFSMGPVRKTLEEAGALLGSMEPEEKKALSARIMEDMMKRNINPAGIDDSWFLEPMKKLPQPLIAAICSLYPPRLMRYVAGLVESRLGVSFGKITLNEVSPPLARQLAFSLLPPAGVRSSLPAIPPGMKADPLEYLAGKPFKVKCGFDEAAVEAILESARNALRDSFPADLSTGHPADLIDSLLSLALALSFHKEEAAALALAMPCRTGRIFLRLCGDISLFIPPDPAGKLFEEFVLYTKL